jgi:4-amino-4-deoxy-L-arabinose transferase-like glycosyltransferase
VSDPTLAVEAMPQRRQIVPRGVVFAAGLLLSLSLLTAPLVPLFDPDEGYCPATAAESIDADRAWDPQFNGEPRWDKPILTYALIEASFAALGRSATSARIPSAIQGAMLVLVVGLAVSHVCGRRPASVCAFVVMTTLGVQVFSRVAHPEIAVVRR